MALGGAAACEVDGILYVVGGETNSWNYPIKSLFAYDPKTDTWTRKADMPTARSGPVAAAVDGIIYAIGGGNIGAGSVTKVVEAYDPKTDTWSTKTPMPTGRMHAGGCTLNGLIYVIGGMTGGGGSFVTVECYDPKTDQWTRKKNLPHEAAGSPVVETVDGIIYSFCDRSVYAYDPATDQWTGKAQIPASPSTGAAVDGLMYLFSGLSTSSLCAHNLSFVYDPAQNKFTSAPEMPVGCVVAASATMGGKIYVVGGASGAPNQCPTFSYYNDLWVFDPQDHPGSWTRKADMPMAIGNAAACEVDGILYVAGGETNSWNYPIKSLFAYDLKTDTWTRKTDMPTARNGPVAAAVDGIIYVMGGGNFGAGTATQVVETYDPKTDTWTRKADMPTARICADACVLNGLIYVLGGWDNSMTLLSSMECYDPKTGQWTRKSDLSVPPVHPIVQVVNGKIHAFFDYATTYIYYPQTDQWIERAQLPKEFRAHASVGGSVDGQIYLFGGLSASSSCAHNLSLAYDPVQTQFTSRRAMPAPTLVAASVTMGGKIYVVGGASGAPYDCPTFTYYNSLWVFDPQGGEYPRIWSCSRPSNDTVRLVWQIEAERIGRRYGFQTKPNVVNTMWGKVGPTVQATNTIMETTLGVSPSDTARYYQVYEAN
ncbi:MAG TPA: kelch repeat-containing protein [Candidatus Paceibacterota bacterium]|nr:kelch repeat-containing protein [Candidatus Paceibacterota bacterium]